MIPEKIGPDSITTINEKSVKSVVDWFDQHKQSLYTLGWSYLRNQQQMEELFYRSILKVRKELSRLKKETSLEMGMTAIFLQTCRELSNSLQVSEETEPLKALDQLEEYEKEAIILTYGKGISRDEVALLLRISVEKVKELLFSGIQSLRKEWGYGSAFNGCREFQKDYIPYLERTMDRSKKIDFEKHVYHCPDCQTDLASFQDVILTLTERMEDLHMPAGFMEKVKDRLAEEEKRRQKKKAMRKRKGLASICVFVLLLGIGYFTGAFTHLYYAWAEDDPELRDFLQQGLGDRLNLEAKRDGVKINIKGVVADDIQTLVFYEIVDTNGDNQYWLNPDDGVYVKNEYRIMKPDTDSMFYPPDDKSGENKKDKNVYQGKISLPPLLKDKGTINLTITKLTKLIDNSANPTGVVTNEDVNFKIGKWSFEIPITKQHSVEYVLHKKIKIEGIPIRFDKLTAAPTVTILQYSIHNEQTKKHIDGLTFDHLEVNHKKVKADRYNGALLNSQEDMNWTTFQTYFNAPVGEKLKEVDVQFGAAHLTIDDQKIIELDASKDYPQTFIYAGSTVSIDKVEAGNPGRVVLSDHKVKNRAYESLQFDIQDDSGSDISSMEMNSEGVLVDRNGVEYDENMSVAYEKIEQPRYFMTVLNIGVDHDGTGEKVNPKRLEIYGYSTTKYLDDVVKLSVK